MANGEKASEETLRFLLQKTMERNEGLVKINHEATLAIPTILGIVWGIIINFKFGSDAISIFALITIGILLIWRYFAHNIDNDVTGNYSRIVCLEYQLKNTKGCSIFNNLISSLIDSIMDISLPEKTSLLTDINGITEEQQIQLIRELHKCKILGYRGHKFWDIVGFVSIIICFIGFFLSCCFNLQNLKSCISFFDSEYLLIFLLFSAIVFVLYSVFIFLIFYDDLLKCNHFHVNPTKREINEAINNAKANFPSVVENNKKTNC